MKKEKTTSFLRQHFPLHLSRFNTLIMMTQGIVLAGHITLSRIASCCGSTAHNESTQKRFSRFLKEIALDPKVWARPILLLLSRDKKRSFDLIIDRTTWKRGQTAINLLFVALRCGNWSAPLCVLSIGESQDIGNSTIEQVQEVLQMAIDILGIKRINVMIGDREFGSMKGIACYQRLGINYCVRLKEQWHIAKTAQGVVFLHMLFKGLEKGQTMTLENVCIGSETEVKTDVTAKRLESGELLLVAHKGPRKQLGEYLKTYKKRWSIERLFLNMKTQGFNIEATGITHNHRLTNLMLVVSLAVAFIINKALTRPKNYPKKPRHSLPPKLKKHGFLSKSMFKWGLEELRACLVSALEGFVW